MKLFIETPENIGNNEEDVLRFAAENFFYIVCYQKDVYRLAEKAKELGLDIPFPLTYNDLLNKKYYGRAIKGVIILNVENLLHWCCTGLNIAGISTRDTEAFKEYYR